MCPKFTTCWNSDQYPQPYFFPKSRWDVEEITVLGVQHHAHLVGKRLKVEVTRDGEYIGTLEKQMWRKPRWNKHPYQQVEHLYVYIYRLNSSASWYFLLNCFGTCRFLHPIRTHLLEYPPRLPGEMRREKVYDFNHQSSEESSVKKLKRGVPRYFHSGWAFVKGSLWGRLLWRGNRCLGGKFCSGSNWISE